MHWTTAVSAKIDRGSPSSRWLNARLGSRRLDRRGDGLDPLGHRPVAAEHHQRVTPVEGHAGVGMHCWLEDVALVAAEVEDNANATLSDVRKEARVVRGGHQVSSGA